MNTKQVVTFLSLTILSSLLLASCGQVSNDVASRNSLTDEQKEQIEQELNELVQIYDVNAITGSYNSNDFNEGFGPDGFDKVSFFSASEEGSSSESNKVIGIWWELDRAAGIVEGELRSDGTLVGSWWGNTGYGKTILHFSQMPDGGMTFAGTWGTGNSPVGYSWIGYQDLKTTLAEEEIAQLQEEYSSLQEEYSDEGSNSEDENEMPDDSESEETTDVIE